jgi:DMSO/TMAO reductase YedYZ molybdopterin-dependent catalytic subunit
MRGPRDILGIRSISCYLRIGFLTVIVALALLVATTYYSSLPPARQYSEGTVTVDGLVHNQLNLTIAEIAVLPKTVVNADIYCYPGNYVEGGNWTGVRLRVILEKAGVSEEAVKIAFYAEDSYATDLGMETAMRDDVIVAYEKDGVLLPDKLRLVVPGWWGYKWIKMLVGIELVDYDFKGTYESRGYPDNAEITTITGM